MARIRRIAGSVRTIRHKPGSRAARVQAYVDAAAPVLNLGDWDIVYRPDQAVEVGAEDDKDTDAEIVLCEGQHAYLRLAESFWTHPPSLQRLILAHELCHAKMRGLEVVVAMLASAFSSRASTRAASDAISTAVTDAAEDITESFARLLTERLPLPKFGKSG